MKLNTENKHTIVLVGGTWDDKGGRPSKIVAQMAMELPKLFNHYIVLNGGYLARLDDLFGLLSGARAVIWMPNVDNKEDKFLPRIKREFPEIFLVQSKRVVEKEYTDFDLVSRMLESHAGMCIKIEKKGERYLFSCLDPLGNKTLPYSNIAFFVSGLLRKIEEILNMTRMRSYQFSGKQPKKVEPEFLEITKTLGEEFTHYVNAVNPNRFLGNVSTRCCHGFPSKRLENGDILVSMRNVNKEIISNDQFVFVTKHNNNLFYSGKGKPSVDTPIQHQLYENNPEINYMVHGHVYVKDAPFTDKMIPCGFLEEVDEVQKVKDSFGKGSLCVNLKGHGCLIMAEDLDFFKNIEFESRPFPEMFWR